MTYTLEQKAKLIDEVLTPEDFPRHFKDLTLCAANWLSFWGLQKEKGIRGYSPQDIAMQAIEKVYHGELDWKPEKGNLIFFIKSHAIKGIVSNLAARSEVKTNNNEEVSNLHVLSGTVSVDQTLDVNMIYNYAKQKLKGDEKALQVLEGRFELYSRAEIIEVFDMTTKEYDNAVKRLATQMRKLEDELNLR